MSVSNSLPDFSFLPLHCKIGILFTTSKKANNFQSGIVSLFLMDNFYWDLKIPVPRRSNRRPDGAQPCKQHSDRALSLMLLGDFETAGFAGSKRRLRSSYASPPQLAGDCVVWHGKKVLAQRLSTIIRNLMNYKSCKGIMAQPP